MKVGIITFHFVPNHGAVLQCYALQTTLERMGHEVSIIDYTPRYHRARYDTHKNIFICASWFANKNPRAPLFQKSIRYAKSLLMSTRSNLKRTDKVRNDLFQRFVRKSLHLTRNYVDYNDLLRDPPCMDAYISGSDQLWNPNLLNYQFDPAYFLHFGDEKTRRIVYAVSLGQTLSTSETEQLKNLCKEIDAISLREYNAESIKAIRRDVFICIDPTLHLIKEDYEEIEEPIRVDHPYIFVYGFESNADISAAVDCAAEKYNCLILNGSPKRIRPGERAKGLQDYSPAQFLTLIKNAACVVTNSFHGTALSIIYKKDFITVAHSTRGIRMTQLVDSLGLRSRLWNSDIFSFETQIDYNAVEEKLITLRKHATDFLSTALDGKKL